MTPHARVSSIALIIGFLVGLMAGHVSATEAQSRPDPDRPRYPTATLTATLTATVTPGCMPGPLTVTPTALPSPVSTQPPTIERVAPTPSIYAPPATVVTTGPSR